MTNPLYEEDPRKTLAYDESVRALSQQQRVLDDLRSRTGILLTAIAIAATFLGGRVLDAAEGQLWALPGAVALGAAAFLSLRVLWPRGNWDFAFSAHVILDGYVEADEPASLDEMHSTFARINQDNFAKNVERLDKLFSLFRWSAALLVVAVVVLLAALGVSGNGEEAGEANAGPQVVRSQGTEGTSQNFRQEARPAQSDPAGN